MSSLSIALIVFACVFGSAMLGLFLHTVLPEHHLSADSKDVVKLGIGLIATMAALVLGLLVSSAKGSFDRTNEELVQSAAKIVMLDRILAQYGPETSEVRALMKRTYTITVELLFSGDESKLAKLDTPETVKRAEGMQAKLRELSPRNDAQRSLQSQAIEISNELSSTRWLVLLQKDSSISTPFLVVLVLWLSVIFASFGLFAPATQRLLRLCSCARCRSRLQSL